MPVQDSSDGEHVRPATNQWNSQRDSTRSRSDGVAEPPDQDPVSLAARAPWFVNMSVPLAPILVAESSDSAFATRFRQVISSTHQNHFPRVDYASDEQIQYLADTDCAWPSPSRARLLVDTTLRRMGRYYHVLLRSTVLEELETHVKSPGTTEFAVRCKLWAVFAIGELYATRTFVEGSTFPGLQFFAKATKMLHVTPERPSLVAVEVRLLLASAQPLPASYEHVLTRSYSRCTPCVLTVDILPTLLLALHYDSL